MNNNPIGIFDSGIGGLTVAQAVTQLLPHENIIYFGDTAHLPYGEKSVAALQSYTVKICELLLQQGCKLILIACHSACSAAYELAKEVIQNKAILVGVINPTVDYLKTHCNHQKIGLIGTRQTVGSNIYQKKIDELNLTIQLSSLATPLLVPLIEEGYANHIALFEILKDYLQHNNLHNITSLLLACTHYPIIKKAISQYYQHPKINLIDPSDITAKTVKKFLTEQGLLNAQTVHPQYKFYFSDYTELLADHARYFFPQALHFEHYPLWG